MFITRKRHDAELEWIREDLNRLSERYWELLSKHERLLVHLNLYEVPVNTIEIRSRKEQ